MAERITQFESKITAIDTSSNSFDQQALASEVLRLKRLLKTTQANLDSFTMTNRTTRDHCHQLTKENAALLEENKELNTKLRQAIQVCQELNELSSTANQKIGEFEEAFIKKDEHISLLSKKLEEKEDFIENICDYNIELQEQFQELEEQFSMSQKAQLGDTQKFKAIGFAAIKFHTLKNKMEDKFNEVIRKNATRQNESIQGLLKKKSSKRREYWNKGLVKGNVEASIPRVTR